MTLVDRALADEPIPGLRELFARFDAWDERIPLDVLSSHLARLDLTREDLSGVSIFDARCYRRNRLRLGAAYEALLVCWRPGQRSPIHDHVGSACAFRVLQGECTETVYELCDDRSRVAAGTAEEPLVRRVSSSVECAGFVCATQDADIHEVANRGEGDLRTLHVYSPPLACMGTYRAEDVQPQLARPEGAFRRVTV